MMFDTHSHLNHPSLKGKLSEEIKQIKEAGVEEILVPGYDLKTSYKAVLIADQNPHIYAAVGIHPSEVLKNPNLSKEIINQEIFTTEYLKKHQVRAIGEIGLDYHWCKSLNEQELQKELFELQIKIAIANKLPIIVHSRDAFIDTYTILKKYHYLLEPSVMHCYTYGPEEAQKFLELGLYLAFGGVITYKNAETIREALKVTPLERLLVETDAPYLSPTPYRGKDNSSRYLPIIIKEISDIIGVKTDYLTKITTKNAKRVFKISD